MNGYTVFRYTLIVLGTIGLVYLFILTHHVWLILWIAILLASAMGPVVDWLQARRVPRSAAIILVYGTIAALSILTVVAVLPPLVNQLVGYLQNEDRLANRLIIAQAWVERFFSQNTGTDVNLGVDPDALRTAVSDVVDTIRVTAPSLVGDIGAFVGDFVLILVMGVYWITSRERAEDFLVGLVPQARRAQAHAILNEIEFGLGAYVRGVALIAFIVGGLCLVGLVLFGVRGAFTISFLYALATVVPIVGGLIGVVLATALAVLSSPADAMVVLIVTILIQQVQNYYLSPRIMARSAEFDELLVIVFIAVGFTLNGVLGALIAIPVAGSVSIILKHLVLLPRQQREAAQSVGGILLGEEKVPMGVQSEPETP